MARSPIFFDSYALSCKKGIASLYGTLLRFAGTGAVSSVPGHDGRQRDHVGSGSSFPVKKGIQKQTFSTDTNSITNLWFRPSK